jgi:hypothetical protein
MLRFQSQRLTTDMIGEVVHDLLKHYQGLPRYFYSLLSLFLFQGPISVTAYVGRRSPMQSTNLWMLKQ